MSDDREGRLEDALTRCRKGDTEAFAEIVREHQAMVFSIAWHYFQDRALAEDLAQDVFLELYQRLSGIESAAHLLFWLRRVTTNRCIDHGRRRIRRREQALEELPEPTAAEAPADPLLTERLQECMAHLTDKQRMAVVLRYQEGLGPAEIAEVMEMPVNTVKSMLHRTLAEMRKRLERTLGEIRYAIF